MAASDFERRTFEANSCLLKEGEKDKFAYLILSGKVEVSKGMMGDNPQTLAVLGKADVLGEMSLFDDHPHMASAVAVEETTVNALSADEFNRRVESLDPLMRGILKISVRRIRGMGEDKTAKKGEVNWSDWKK